MRLKSLNFFFENFESEKMNFLYTGDFSDDHTDGFIELNNQQFNAADELKKSQRKAGFLIAECFQNIVRHNELSNQDSYFHIKNSKPFFSLVSGNTVQNNIIPLLKEQLEQLNKLTNEELKAKFRKVLAEGDFSNKGGAGLGMIEMARKSKNKLCFHFTEIDSRTSYFYFRLQLNFIDTNSTLVPNEFDSSILFRNKMLEDDLFFIYKGVISTETTTVILSIIESSFKQVKQKIVFVKFMGMFQKVSELELFGKEENSSLLVIGENEEEYNITASCYLNRKEAIEIDAIIKEYSTLGNSKLIKEYKRVLSERNIDKKRPFNLEFIDIIKNCSKFEFDFQPHTDDLVLISFTLGFQIESINSSSVNSVIERKEDSLESASELDSSFV